MKTFMINKYLKSEKKIKFITKTRLRGFRSISMF